MITPFESKYTLIEALSELYTFNPRKKKDSQIMFELYDEDEPFPYRFGKHWDKLSKKWLYFTHNKFGPCLASEEKHFISNLFCCSWAGRQMHYAAQQGTYQIRKVFDSRLDRELHNSTWNNDNS